MKAIRRLTVHTVLPEPLHPLGELAINLRWSWHEPTRQLFAAVDPVAWERVGEDPMAFLGEVPAERLAELAGDAEFVARVAAADADLTDYLAGQRWFQTLDERKPRAVAYFSPEYGIAQALPQYSGGLGILAGDHLKAASDLGVPIIGVGLFYRSGYFRQTLSADGWQQETYPVLDPDGLPLTLLREADGSVVRIELSLPDGDLTALVRVAQVGRVPLLLLDADVEQNDPQMRDVTDRLYGGTNEHRLRQELLLGVGGVRAVRAFCRLTAHPQPEVFHTNEGHAGFLGVERIRELVAHDDLTFDQALEAVRAGTVFTTHTPVAAGIDRFPRELVAKAFSGMHQLPGVPVDQILALGAETFRGGDHDVFNMAVMGFRLAQRANGVSRLHGAVSREMFAGLWPNLDSEEVPITSITNGVHAPTWVSPLAANIVRKTLGPDLLETGEGWEQLGEIGDAELWAVKRAMRETLVAEVRRRLHESWRNRGASDVELSWIDSVLDPDVLTIGFARRVPSYKRLTLMLRDSERLTALLKNEEQPVQIVVAGKAHPSDDAGKKLIQDLVEFADTAGVRDRIVFLPDYDIGMAQVLYPGCDIWLNNPLRPLEACGTSGMKAALNGALNVSIRDGWWDEWFDGNNGWAIPTADGVLDTDRRDDLEAAALYELLESGVTQLFYDRSADGLPTRWIQMVRHTLSTLGPKVLASRMVHDYVQKLYTPAAVSSRAASADDFELAKDLSQWKQRIRQCWSGVRVEHVDAHGIGDDPQLGGEFTVHSHVVLGELDPDDVTVQLMSGRVDADDLLVSPQIVEMIADGGDSQRTSYSAALRMELTGPFGYTVRVIPRHRGLATVGELGLASSAG